MIKIGEEYDKNLPTYKEFCVGIQSLIERLVRTYKIDVHSITNRIKNKDSLLEKCKKKGYKELSNFTDIVGIRIITFVLEDVEKIRQMIKKEFDVDNANSEDKFTKLKVDQTGYLSVHYILRLGKPRCNQSEWAEYNGYVFELQIRTLLQHAWASMSHDNMYKFNNGLPSEIERRFYLAAGTLELLDIEFQRLSDELVIYRNKISQETKAGNLKNIEINAISLSEYLGKRFCNASDSRWLELEKSLYQQNSKIIDQMKLFGINYIADLDNILSDEFTEILRNVLEAEKYYDVGLLRSMMIISDAEKYFAHCLNEEEFIYCGDKLYEYVNNLNDIAEKNEVKIYPF